MDKTPPRNRLIAIYSALAVVTLFALKPVFDSYFDQALQQASSLSLEIGQDTADLDRSRAEWGARDVYVAEAMERLSRQGRTRIPQLRPRPTEGIAPAERHWNIMPEEQRPQAPAPARRPDAAPVRVPAGGAPGAGEAPAADAPAVDASPAAAPNDAPAAAEAAAEPVPAARLRLRPRPSPSAQPVEAPPAPTGEE
jgi:translation initiation factor IF-2